MRTAKNLWSFEQYATCKSATSITEKAAGSSIGSIHVHAVLTSTHNLCFSAEIRKIMYIPVNPSFTI